jgi:hypothetical protein
MTGLSQEWITSITIIIAALPAIGALLRQYSQAKKRKLDGHEIAALYLTLWGFLLFVSLAEGLGLPTVRWYLGWGLPILVGLVFTVISVCLIYKKY